MSSSGSRTPSLLQDRVGRLLDDRRARVVVLVDAVAEAHELDAVLLVLDLLDEGVDVAAVLEDAVEHLEDRRVGATVQRAGEGVDARGDGVEEVGVGRADESHRRRRAVLLVVGVQDEELVEGLDHVGVDVVVRRRDAERHPEEVLLEGELVVRVEERLADALLVGVGRDRRQLGEEADRRDLDVLLVERVEAVLVEGAERRDRRRQDRHRVGVAREAVEERLEVLVQHRVLAHPLGEAVELGLRRQLAVDEEVGHLEEAGLLGQLLDRVARGSAGCPRHRRCR